MTAETEASSSKRASDEVSNSGPNLGALPAGVVEHRGILTLGGIVERRDGTLLLTHANHAGLQEGWDSTSEYRASSDAGRTWGTPQPLDCGMGIWGMIRLQSGKLAAYGDKRYGDKPVYFSSSPDDGKTWTPPVDIGTYQDFIPMFHSMVQLAGGRLLLVGYWEGLNATAPDTIPHTQTGWGLWRGRMLFCEGHRGVELGVCIAYYSDDEGITWKQCEGGLFGWFDERGIPNGEGGIIDVYEPTAAETADGRVLMFLRSKVGRLLRSYSLNDGQTWHSVLPTELSSSQSPPLLIQIPKTGDLLCVWNQVSCEEIRCGFLRGRLSAAISRDSGMTWQNFRTLELQEGMEDIARIAPEFPISRRVVGRPGLGHLPDGFAMFTYPNVDIVGDSVIIRYSRMWPAEKGECRTQEQSDDPWPKMWPKHEEREAEMNGEGVMRIYPLEWFYH